MYKSYINFLIISLVSTIGIAQDQLKVPTFEEILTLPYLSNPQISPNGKDVLYEVRTADWEANRYDTEIWLSKNGGKPIPLTYNPNSSSYAPKWSPDGKWIAFLSDRGNGSQIQVIRTEGGESFPATSVASGIYNFEWSPSGNQFTFLMSQPTPESERNMMRRYGNFEIEDEGYKHNWLYTIDFQPEELITSRLPCQNNNDCFNWPQPIALIDNVDFSIGVFKWSPDGSKIAFDKQPNELINSYLFSDIGILDVLTKKWDVLVSNPSFDFVVDWSPDSKSLAYITALDKHNSTYYHNNHLYTIDIETRNTKEIAKGFDEELKDVVWTNEGIYAMAYQKTDMHLFIINPNSGNIQRVPNSPDRVYTFSIDDDGTTIAFLSGDHQNLKELFYSPLDEMKPIALTSNNNLISNWKVAKSEVISWFSKDGTKIEGILFKPYNYNSSFKYPLMVNVHGGPTAADRPTPVPSFYPALQWLDKGALMLMVNYRGSGGYGEEFRSLNVENLGLGAIEDILSGVDYLDQKNMIDTSRMGCMGWSHGGFISALMATTSDRFKAISVGAGISNWATFYSNTDLHPETIQYLKATPWSKPSIYAKTSPITYINEAKTPTLIQHGEYDARVPIENAYELLQGLRDMGVDNKLIIYKGLGHRIYKPKERLAAVWHNWQWFGKYVFEDDILLPTD